MTIGVEQVKELVVFGVKVKDTDFSFYNTTQDISQWSAELWKVLEQTYTKEERKGIINFTQILEPEFQKSRVDRMEYLFMQEQLKIPVKVNGVEYKAIFIFDLMWESWDCDGTAWVVQTQEGNKVVFTNHGSHYFIENDELQERVDNYNEMMESKKGEFSVETYLQGIQDIEHARTLIQVS
jgi:hypothetical protein